MNYFLPLLFGFCISFLAVILPGLINMTGAKISMQEGKNEALSFAFGASLVVFFQTFIAVLFARYINNHQRIVATLQEIGIFVFIGLSIYFFGIAKKSKKLNRSVKIKGKPNRFFLGFFFINAQFFAHSFLCFR